MSHSFGEQVYHQQQAGQDLTGRTAIDLTAESDDENQSAADPRYGGLPSEAGDSRGIGREKKRQKGLDGRAANGEGIEITSSKYPAAFPSAPRHLPAISPSRSTSSSAVPQTNGAPQFGYPALAPPSYPAGPSNYATNGSTQRNAIDLTNRPSPPPAPPQAAVDRKPLCIGSVHSKVTMIYPSPAVVIGQDVQNSRENLVVVPYRGAEMLKVRLKYRQAGMPVRENEPVASQDQDVVQVLSPASSIYIGELDHNAQRVFLPLLQRGLIRLEGYVQRIHPDAHQYQATIFVLVFTLPSNIMFIANHLASSHCYLVDPMPDYDPSRHNDSRYDNAHKDYYIPPQNSSAFGLGPNPWAGPTGMILGPSKANQIEVQREQVDEVFKSLKDDMKLAESEPGPFIKTQLFSHQKQALTFLREQEREPAAIEAAMNTLITQASKLELDQAMAAEEVEVVDKDGRPEHKEGTIPKYRKRDRSKEDWTGRSLWETFKDEFGKITGYKNRITGESRKAKKDEDRPEEARGAILADDMGLGKTLSIVSLIASTLESARDFASGEVILPPPPEDTGTGSGKQGDLKAAHFANKVHGMPQTGTAENSEAETETSGRSKAKKRKRELEEERQRSSFARRSRIVQRTRATLLVCPLSTVSNWEDQIKEHWLGDVFVVGGAAGVAPPKKPAATWAGKKKDPSADVLTDHTLRVYIYHGTSRRPDPEFIANFDIVITTFSTLATEFNKLSKVAPGQDDSPAPDDGSDKMELETDEAGVPLERSRVEQESSALEAALPSKGKGGKGSSSLAVKALGDVASPLQSLEWFRVVLDEAHFIKESTTVASRAACFLEAERRIALTGTPIQNKLDDVWALFKFLRLTPLDSRDVFVDKVLALCKSGAQVGLARLQLIMRSCTLRRTKDMTGENGKKILELPERREYQQWLTFREDERVIYDSIKTAVAAKVHELKKQKQLGKNYATVLQEAMRLRQICDHVDLIKSGPVEEDYDGTVMDYDVAVAGIEANGLNQARGVSIIAYLKDTDAARCVECDQELADRFPSLTLGDDDLKPEVEEKPETDGKAGRKGKKASNPVLTACQHVFCLACFKKAVCPTYPKGIKGVGRPCSACGKGLRLQYDVLEIAPPGTQDDVAEAAPRPPRKRYQRPPGEKPTLSTKMQYLLEKLLASSRVNKHSKNYDIAAFAQLKPEEYNPDGSPIEIKTVVFSQWTTMLDRIGDMLEECQIKYARLDGTMTRDDRTAAMQALKTDPATEVLLVSIRAGGVGLNLVTASRCFIMEPYWNPSVEAQAIDRIHRMGQTKPVEAIKLMMNDSIEVKMSERQKKKNTLAKLTLKGMSKAELLERRMDELVELFS